MKCSAERANTGNAAVIVGCMVHAESLLRFSESAYTLLRRPENLRIRSNNLVSQVFQFSGGQAVSPETFYNFLVMPSGSGFFVTNQ
jgi:hypothetical protein